MDVVDDAKGLLPVRVPMLCCCLRVTIAIVIAIVGSRSGCSCCCGVPAALGGKDVLTMLLIEDVPMLLMMLKDCCRSWSVFRCCVVCISRLPLQLTNRFPVVVVAADVVFYLHSEEKACWQ